MSRHRRTILLLVVAVVVAWGGVHLLSATPVSVAPATWPGTGAAAASPSPASLTIAAAPPAPSATAGTDVPILPGAMQQLNASTETTATGIWALLQELETALGQRLGALVGQLEPGR